MTEETAKTPSWYGTLIEAWPFSSLPPVIVELLAHHMRPRRFRRGEFLIRQGDPGDSLIFVADGRVEVSVADKDEKRLTIARPGRGEIVGEMALLTHEPRTADVAAITDVEALVLSAHDFQALANRHPSVSVVLTDLAARRLGSGEFDALHGKMLGDYRIKRCLGRGGMAVVYEAEARADNRRVALKMMSHRLVYEPQTFQRFQREATIVESLRHENIAAVFGRFEAYGTYFIVMEFCDGPTLAQVLERGGPLAEPDIRRILGQLARALSHVHRSGIVHRDLKPSNVMLNLDGTLKLMDFGIARSEAKSELTQKGMILGTPRYMPPEQLAGQPVDCRADIYAYGCIAHALLTGRPIFEGDDLAQVLYQKLTWKLPPRDEIRKGLPADLHDLLEKSLAIEPAKRSVDLEALSAWAGRIATAELYPYPLAPDEGCDTTRTVPPR